MSSKTCQIWNSKAEYELRSHSVHIINNSPGAGGDFQIALEQILNAPCADQSAQILFKLLSIKTLRLPVITRVPEYCYFDN